MPLKRPFEALTYVVLILLSIFAWVKFSYPQLTLIDLSITRPQAARIAESYLCSVTSIDPGTFKQSVIFDTDSMTDLYLQKAIGWEREEKFLARHQFEMYFWTVRFFKEGQKEEYRVSVSSKTGEVISYIHILDDAAARPAVDEKVAKERAMDFLRRNFQFNLEEWAFNEENKSKFDNRIEHKFTWEKKDVYVPWDPRPDQGGGKIITFVTITGDEIKSFVKMAFLSPEQFSRYVERRKESGRNLGLVANIGSIVFVIAAIWVVLARRNALCMNATKKYYIYFIGLLFVLTIISAINNTQGFLHYYPTTQPFFSYFARQAIYELIDRFLFFGAFIIPCLAGELLRFESFPNRPWMSLYHYVTTTFLSRNVTKAILFGYCSAVLMFGLQTVIFEFGHRFFDVWVEQERLSTFSTAYFPFFGILMVAVTAGVTEETFFRLFGFNLVFNLTRSSLLAFLVPSIIWGLGHTGYMVFPFWFRGLEVALLGVFTCFVYRRFGLITVVVQHYLFDAFWGGSVYIFAKSAGVDFWMSIVILLIPAVFALTAFLCNRPVVQRDVQWNLNKQQKYNLEIIRGFIDIRKNDDGFNPDLLRRELISNGWDVAVVEVAFHQLKIPLSSVGG